jgi:(2Fe-2S) ferredoxin
MFALHIVIHSSPQARRVLTSGSHKTRDKRCHIAAGVLRPALITCLEKNGIAVDETGASLGRLDGPPLEELEGTDAEREAEVGRRIETIDSVHGGHGGEVGLFNINHLGGHRYAGVMLVSGPRPRPKTFFAYMLANNTQILFPSGAYLSYGRVTPHEIPRVVEETILQGKVVPGLLRSGTGLARPGATGKDCGFLGW